MLRFISSFVSVWVVELTKIRPFCGEATQYSSKLTAPATSLQHDNVHHYQQQEMHNSDVLPEKKSNRSLHGDEERSGAKDTPPPRANEEPAEGERGRHSTDSAQLASELIPSQEKNDARVFHAAAKLQTMQLSDSGQHRNIGTSMGDSFENQKKTGVSSVRSQDELLPAPRFPSNAAPLKPRLQPADSEDAEVNSELMKTLIPADRNAPLGLDYREFIQGSSESTRGGDDQLIHELIEPSDMFKSVMKQKLKDIKIMASHWQKGDIKGKLA